MLTRRNESDTVLRTLDWSTVIIYLIMVLAGVISIYAASYDYDDAAILSFDEFSGKQALWIGLGLCIAGVIMLIEVRMFETYAYPIYVLTLLLLLVTPFLAPDIKGSRSWLVLGPMSLQPAEFAKFATALALAKLFSGYNFLLNAKISNYVRAITIIILPVILNRIGADFYGTILCLVSRGHERHHTLCSGYGRDNLCSGSQIHRRHNTGYHYRTILDFCTGSNSPCDNDVYILSPLGSSTQRAAMA